MDNQLQIKIDSIKKAVKSSYDELPETFSVLKLNSSVRKLMRKRTTDCSITRRLRELRSEGKIDYKVIDSINGIYQKQ